MRNIIALFAAGFLAAAYTPVLADDCATKSAACCATKTAKAQLTLPGVTCEQSAGQAQAALLKVKGVKSVSVCSTSHMASVEYDKTVTSSRKISSAAKKAGFKVAKRS